jgi:von Willebrand factor type A domain
MQPQIDAMMSKVQSLTNQIKDTGMDVKYALVTFKDNVSIKANWTSDPNDFKDSINTLKAIGGGDVPENSLDAIENVISMGFRPDAQKVILVITDAPAHYKGDGTTYSMYTKDEVMSDLKKNGIIFIPVSPTFKSPTEAVDLRDIAMRSKACG